MNRSAFGFAVSFPLLARPRSHVHGTPAHVQATPATEPSESADSDCARPDSLSAHCEELHAALAHDKSCAHPSTHHDRKLHAKHERSRTLSPTKVRPGLPLLQTISRVLVFHHALATFAAAASLLFPFACVYKVALTLSYFITWEFGSFAGLILYRLRPERCDPCRRAAPQHKHEHCNPHMS